jgi:hypothetical protein
MSVCWLRICVRSSILLTLRIIRRLLPTKSPVDESPCECVDSEKADGGMEVEAKVKCSGGLWTLRVQANLLDRAW